MNVSILVPPDEPLVELQVALDHGISEAEYAKILIILGRKPTYTEIGIFSVMWSEHCSYKNSITELKKLPRSGKRLLVNAGEENAGMVDIGDGLAVVFKIESHNHPSAVEPYQGAATGVGGIMRDIFTMGARPIGALNSLRFGDPKSDRTRYLVKGIVKGIGDYGNSFGVPTIAGDVYFSDCYNDNPLVNAMAVGIVEIGKGARAIAKGAGNIVLIVGSATGRDGIHGATFASEELSDESETKRPSVQVGDPFTEKLLLEASLEVIRAGLLIGIQDMGAAGITCSAAEMSAKGGVGMELDLRAVPIREHNMTPYEIMLSESQERMLLVVSPENVSPVKEIFGKWDLHCQPIGIVTEDGILRATVGEKVFAAIPAQSLVLGGGAPVYSPAAKKPEYLDELHKYDTDSIPEPENYHNCFLKIITSPNICSRRWISEQYDSMVRTNTLFGSTLDAAILRIKGSRRALAVKTDCNSRYVYLDPYKGAQIAVAESARNVVCVGAKPLAITNCLNFGNPHKPEIYWQFKEAVRGMGDACRALNTPVTGGNVSFYNESADGAIYPSPIIGMVGLIEDPDSIMTADFKDPGDVIFLLGHTNGHLGGSEYLHVVHGRTAGRCPDIDLSAELALQGLCLNLIRLRLIKSAHDVSEGGLLTSIAESCFASYPRNRRIGVRIEIPSDIRPDRFLFGEDQSRIIITTSSKRAPAVLQESRKVGVGLSGLGIVTNDGVIRAGEVSEWRIEEIKERFDKRLKEVIESD